MPTLEATVCDFFAEARIAVADVSRDRDVPGNTISRMLLDTGYAVVPINPRTDVGKGVR